MICSSPVYSRKKYHSPGLKVPVGRRAMINAENERTAALIVSKR
jgi:hypothetical protein